MSFLNTWECELPQTCDKSFANVSESKIKVEKKTLQFLKKLSLPCSSQPSKFKPLKVLKETYYFKYGYKKFYMEKPSFLDIDTNELNIKISHYDVQKFKIPKQNLQIKKESLDFIKQISNKNLNSAKRNNIKMHKYENVQLLKSVNLYERITKPGWENWTIDLKVGDLLDKEILNIENVDIVKVDNTKITPSPKKDLKKYILKQSFKSKDDSKILKKPKISIQKWDEPVVNDINVDLLKYSEDFNNKVFFTKTLPVLPGFKLKSNFKKLLMWEIDINMLKKMVWKIFTIDPRANNVIVECLDINCCKEISNISTVFSMKLQLEYIFPNLLTFRVPLESLKNENREINMKLSVKSQEISDSDEFDSFVNRKIVSQQLTLPPTDDHQNTENTNVAVNESTFYFDVNSVTKSFVILDKPHTVKYTNKPSVFCNFNKLNKKILKKLYQSNQITILEGDNQEFANFQCQIILNQKTCISFISCHNFFQMNPKTMQLYIYFEIMQLCEFFENIYFVFTDTEDQSIENVQRCKLGILENFQQFSNINIFEIESDYYETGFTNDVLVPLILQNFESSKQVDVNDLVNDTETIYELIAMGFDLYTANILNSVDGLINKVLNNQLNSHEKNIVTDRILDKIIRCLEQ